jgi:hypothetical protein
MAKTLNRKKVNFMVDVTILGSLEELVPAGSRSDFINESLSRAILRFKKGKAVEGIRKLATKSKLKLSSEEIRKLRNYGRK